MAFENEATVTVYGDVLRESPAAVLFVDASTGEELWIPKSQINDQNHDHWVITQWIAEKKGLV
jgi:hypothetical protein